MILILDKVAVVLLTLPWISLVIDALDALDPEIIGHPLWGNLAVLIYAAINASILFFTTYWAGSCKQGGWPVGITIYYRGTLENPERVQDLQRELSDVATSM